MKISNVFHSKLLYAIVVDEGIHAIRSASAYTVLKDINIPAIKVLRRTSENPIRQSPPIRSADWRIAGIKVFLFKT
jgi:hypothetical protein